MRNRILRALVVLMALAAQGGAGYVVWQLELAGSRERSAADTFDRQARALGLALAELRAAFQAYVADGQNPPAWQRTAGDLQKLAIAQARALRDAARSPEAQGAVEDAIELIASLDRVDARAKGYLASGQRLSASDVVFAEAAPLTTRAGNALDVARGHESVASAATLERLRLQQVYTIGAALGVTLLALLMLLPLPRRPRAGSDEEGAEAGEETGQIVSGGLGLSHVAVTTRHREPAADAAMGGDRGEAAAAPPAAPAVDLTGVAEVCAALARVQEPRELPALLERAARVLGAEGLVVWMPDAPGGALRPALAHGYPPLAVTRMGTIPPDASNATALAFRTQTTQAVPADPGGSAAVAAPLVTPDGCSGVMAAELAAADQIDQARALATILASQLATLISPPQAAQRPGP